MRSRILVCAALVAALGLSAMACKQQEKKTATITVWDYYGKEVSPIRPLIEAFQKENPEITVVREDLDWETMHTKLNVVLSTSNVPDLVTIDMTWLPTYASLGVFADLGSLSKGKLNGKPLQDAWAPLSIKAMTNNGKIITALYDFDAYALYYRSDLLAAKGLAAPRSWDELLSTSKAISSPGKNLYAFLGDTFHASQFIYENGGSILSADNKSSALTSRETVDAVQYYADLVRKHKVAMNWTPDEGDLLQGAKDGRISMFADGPYRMAQLRQIAPEMAGKWAIAPHPYSKKPGSYLGGTGLCIPEKSANKEAAWKFIEFLLRPENAVLVYTKAGAAPALLAALDSPEVNAPDPYFGGQKPMAVFKTSMESAGAFPNIRQWSDVDVKISETLRKIASTDVTVEAALGEASKTIDDALKE
jgi:multiple sugar transport system substrate-binding protein